MLGALAAAERSIAAGTGVARLITIKASAVGPPKLKPSVRTKVILEDVMSSTWILVADAARARLFELARKGADPIEIACYSYPDGRSPGREHDHGRLPRVQESNGNNRHAIEPRTPLREKHARRFADILSAIVQRGRQERRYDGLILMGPPRFLGMLHDCLDAQTAACVVGEVRNDLVTLSPAQLRAHLPA